MVYQTLNDVESDWALKDAQGFGLKTKHYGETLQKHYQAFWERNIAVDILSKEDDLEHYKILLIPMLYMVSKETATKLQAYVKNGGTLVGTYITGLVDESDLTYLGGWYAPLKEMFGIEPTETDTFYPSDRNHVSYKGQSYEVRDYATLMNMAGAETLGTYEEDFYKGTSAVTRNEYHNGQTYYIGARLDDAFHQAFYGELIDALGLKAPLDLRHKRGVSVQAREAEGRQTIFIMNFTEETQAIEIMEDVTDLQTNSPLSGTLDLAPYEVRVVEKVVR
jgi:beta-galactosidase